MIEVEIRNFQAIRQAVFQIQGFTAMVGRSNIGKSAVVRALKCALTGATGTDFVRHGESCERRARGNKKCNCFATVRIKTPQAEFVWEKGDNKNQYTVTKPGEEPVLYTAVDRGTPDFLKPEFAPVKVGSDTKSIQVSDQFSPIFLLDQSGPTVADVLSDVARLDTINGAIRLVNKDAKDAKATRKVREKDAVALEAQLEGYKGLDKAVKRVAAVEQGHEALEKAQQACSWLTERMESLAALEAAEGALSAATKPTLPAAADLDDKGQAVTQLHTWYDEVRERAPAIRGLRGVEKVTLPTVEPIENKGDQLAQVGKWVDRLIGFKSETAKWKGFSATTVPATTKLEEHVSKLVKITKLDDQLYEAGEDQIGLEHDLHEAEEELAEVLAEFEELGICPTCSQRIEAGHVHRAMG